jgi:hypothetical protein
MPNLTREQAGAAIWERLFQSVEPELTAEAARAILALDFPSSDKARVKELAAKARAGELTPAEQNEADAYAEIGSLVAMLRAHARSALKKAVSTTAGSRV